MSLLPGTRLGPYEVIAPLGAGGVGEIYRGLHSRDGREVVLKVLPAQFYNNPERRQHFENEVRAAETLNHPLQHSNILQVYNWGESDGLVYLAVEYVDGCSLAQLMRRGLPIEVPIALAIVRQIGLALEFAHGHGIIHRDIKPGNVLLSRQGRVLVADFSLAIAPGASTLTGAGRILGTPRYMAPEQAMGTTVDGRSDIFSLGVVLYEILAGRPAFQGETAIETFRAIVEEDPPPLRTSHPQVPTSIEWILSKMLAKAPRQRFDSARELVLALDAAGFATDAADRIAELVQSCQVEELVRFGASPPPASTGTATRSVVGSDEEELRIGALPTGDDPTSAALPYSRQFEELWNALTVAASRRHKEDFVRFANSIAHGMLREAVGYRIEHPIPYYRSTVGYMVDVPMLWIRHSRFPILFVAFDPHEPDVLPVVVKQLEIAKATEFFALLIVVPTGHDATGTHAQELHERVADSVYRHDFVVLDGRQLADIVEEGTTRRLVEIVLQQGIGLTSLSPYVVNGPVPEKMFFGREQEVKIISQNLDNRDYAILGGRRIGKSSILLRLNGLLNTDPRFRAIYVNCEDKFDYRDFLDPLSSDFGVRSDCSDSLAFRSLVTALARQAPSTRLVFLLDEVDELVAFDAHVHDGPRLFKTFRSLSHEGICRFVFSGSRTLSFSLRDPQSPFFNFCEGLILRPLDERSVAEIVVKPMRQLGIDLPEEGRLIDLLIQLTSSHPNLTQWLCDRLVKRTIETSGGVPVFLDDLAATLRTSRRAALEDLTAIAMTRDFHEYYIGTAWGDARPLERLISLTIQAPSFQVSDVQAALEPYGISDRQMIAESLETLDLYSLIERRGQRYHFRLAEFPRIAREFEGIDVRIQSALSDFERHGHGSNRRPS